MCVYVCVCVCVCVCVTMYQWRDSVKTQQHPTCIRYFKASKLRSQIDYITRSIITIMLLILRIDKRNWPHAHVHTTQRPLNYLRIPIVTPINRELTLSTGLPAVYHFPLCNHLSCDTDTGWPPHCVPQHGLLIPTIPLSQSQSLHTHLLRGRHSSNFLSH